MHLRFYSNRPDRQKGSVAIEVAIIAIAGFIVAILGSVAMLSTSFIITGSGEETIEGGVTGSAAQLVLRTGVVAESGEVDVDGNDVILLSGVDELAVAKLKMVLEVSTDVSVDLTPPNTTDDTLVDPDASGLSPRAFITLSWNEFTTNGAEWSVLFLGDSDGDYHLEQGERAEITIWLHEYDGTNVLYDLGTDSSDGFVDTAIELLQQRDEFAIEINVGGSTPLTIQRTLPLELGTSDLLD
ncbi:hypothetical protein [Candidatus Lucifugimonas marina]|jgi:archaellin|uniref:Flagellin n=1 Tax=Candidatus Lucifugimonas marina TaxID=3038979 RepID=A0AAJ5ZHZ3_9CHLR|nr:hypothetical protein [SAR202 cluster bacterium JH702]WFG39122.1 hypothetical protein GKO48_05640 [SAR202 cluster bacterium JH1073]